jgi:methyl-accepting chemotaxis protein
MSEKHDRVAMVSDLTAAVKQLEKRISDESGSLEKRLEKRISDESGSLEKRLEKRISEEGALTRTHFNVMVERVESAVKPWRSQFPPLDHSGRP